MSSVESALALLLAPFDTETFLEDFWSKNFFALDGPSDKFASLFTWQELNRVLEEHRLKPPRLVLFKEGRQVDPTSFLQFDDKTKDFAVNHRVLNAQLHRGATLVLNNVDELYAPLRTHIGQLEQSLQLRIHANLYASWRSENGFRLHWDDTDTFILQVAGNKHWTVYRPTIPAPIRDFEKVPVPTEPAVWDELLEQGSLLYVPRGWWHLVKPTNLPSLHLTVTLQKSTGTQFLHRAVDEVRLLPGCRSDVPYLADSGAKLRFLEELMISLRAELTLEKLNDYLQKNLDSSRHRTVFDLPNEIDRGNAEIGTALDR